MRSIWKGTIGFGLVNIPVKLYSATSENLFSMDMLDSRDHARIRYRRVNENTQKEVPFEKIVKGFEVNDRYVILDEKDFEDASPKKTKMIEIENFVDLNEVDPIYYETSYYSEPETQGKKAYVLLRKSLQKAKKAGLARFVLRSRENLCILHPIDQTVVITKIRFASEIRPTDDLQVPKDLTITPKELAMGMALIEQYSDKFDIGKFKDEYHTELLRIIKAKAAGKRPLIRKLKPENTKSDDLYEQLLQSLKRKGA